MNGARLGLQRFRNFGREGRDVGFLEVGARSRDVSRRYVHRIASAVMCEIKEHDADPAIGRCDFSGSPPFEREATLRIGHQRAPRFMKNLSVVRRVHLCRIQPKCIVGICGTVRVLAKNDGGGGYVAFSRCWASPEEACRSEEAQDGCVEDLQYHMLPHTRRLYALSLCMDDTPKDECVFVASLPRKAARIYVV